MKTCDEPAISGCVASRAVKDQELYGGVETGGTWINCAIGRGPDELVAATRFPTGPPGETIERIVAFFSEHERVVAVGVGAFGPLDLDRSSATWGYVTSTPKPGWQHTSLGRPLSERLGVPVCLDTDVNAAAVAEHRWGAGQGTASLAYLTVGTGIGLGLLRDGGRPWRGLLHPEGGHIRIAHDLARDPFAGVCPLHGDCWEGLASGPAIGERWGAAADLPADHPAWRLEAEYLAAGIIAIVSIASPHRVIVGGGVMEQPSLLALVRERFGALNAGYLPVGELDEYMVGPALGDEAGVLGAIALARDVSSR